MLEFWTFFLILFAALTFSTVFSRFHLPWVLALIIGGMVLGPFGFGWIRIDHTIEFFAQIGLVFLMFMAGIETPFSKIRHNAKQLSLLALINGLIPFIVGVLIVRGFGYEWQTALLVGIVFISSSVALIIPTLEANGLIETRIGQAILSSTIMQDVASLIVLSILLQTVQPETSIPLPIFYTIVVILFIAGRYFISKMRSLFHAWRSDQPDIYETELRVIFVLLLGTVLFFELLGLHAIIGGFITGLLLSDTITSKQLRLKLHAISFGVFIPVFFVIVGAKSNILVIFEQANALYLACAIVFGSFFSKLISGWAGARMLGYNETQSRLYAFSSTPQLTTTLAVVFTGFSFGILDQQLVNAMILLTLFTTFAGSLLSSQLIRSSREQLVQPVTYLE